jgi:hypothetical protein
MAWQRSFYALIEHQVRHFRVGNFAVVERDVVNAPTTNATNKNQWKLRKTLHAITVGRSGYDRECLPAFIKEGGGYMVTASGTS